MASILLGFFGGIVGWFFTTAIAQPLLGFLNSRMEAARVLALYERFHKFDPDMAELYRSERYEVLIDSNAMPSRVEEQKSRFGILEERRKALEFAGSHLIAFDSANQFLSKQLRKFFKMKPREAGHNLILLSQMDAFRAPNEQVHDEIMKALRVGRPFGTTRI